MSEGRTSAELIRRVGTATSIGWFKVKTAQERRDAHNSRILCLKGALCGASPGVRVWSDRKAMAAAEDNCL
jgi:hypothetical protein